MLLYMTRAENQKVLTPKMFRLKISFRNGVNIVMGENHHGLSSQEISMFLSVPTFGGDVQEPRSILFLLCVQFQNHIYNVMGIMDIFALLLTLGK